VVEDYRTHGGLDVLAAMFALDELPLEGSFIVEGLDFWLEVFTTTAAKAVVRMSLDDMRAVERILDDAISAHASAAAVAAEMELQDVLARLSGSVLFRMLNNSTYSLRLRLVRDLHETEDVSAALGEMKQMLRAAAFARPAEEVIRERLLDALKRLTAKLRERLIFGEAKASAPRGATKTRAAVPGSPAPARAKPKASPTPSRPRTKRATR
ncbi:MAG: hypothetical protein IT385_24015, partial [Deltaproteobacteria bacterium]|nr:hypothetical protein [Deltaproteobacteria bacterium]